MLSCAPPVRMVFASFSDSMSSKLNEYFLPGFGISRRVIQTEIQSYCGPESFARPYTLHVSLERANMIPAQELLESKLTTNREEMGFW